MAGKGESVEAGEAAGGAAAALRVRHLLGVALRFGAAAPAVAQSAGLDLAAADLECDRAVRTANQAAANILETTMDSLSAGLFTADVSEQEFLFQFGVQVQAELEEAMDCDCSKGEKTTDCARV